MKQSIVIPMGINSATFWANIFLYFYEEEYILSLVLSENIKMRHLNSRKHFINDVYAIDDGADIGRFFCDIYPMSLSLRLNIIVMMPDF